MSQDQSYFAARATQERRLAMAAADPNVRRIHLQLAEEYTLRAGADPNEAQEPSSDEDQRTA